MGCTISTAMDCLVGCLRVLANVTTPRQGWVTSLLECDTIVTTLFRLIQTSASNRVKSPALSQHRSLLHSSPKLGPSSSPFPVSNRRKEFKPSSDIGTEASVDETEGQKMDIICLALGLLINLVEKSEGLKDRVRLTGESKPCTF